jgi:hypothetical protein
MTGRPHAGHRFLRRYPVSFLVLPPSGRSVVLPPLRRVGCPRTTVTQRQPSTPRQLRFAQLASLCHNLTTLSGHHRERTPRPRRPGRRTARRRLCRAVTAAFYNRPYDRDARPSRRRASPPRSRSSRAAASPSTNSSRELAAQLPADGETPRRKLAFVGCGASRATDPFDIHSERAPRRRRNSPKASDSSAASSTRVFVSPRTATNRPTPPTTA